MSKSIKELKAELLSLKYEAEEREKIKERGIRGRFIGSCVGVAIVLFYGVFTAIDRGVGYAIKDVIFALGSIAFLGGILFVIQSIKDFNKLIEEEQATTDEEIEKYEKEQKSKNKGGD